MGSCSGQRFEDRDAIVGADGASVCLSVKDTGRQNLDCVVCVLSMRDLSNEDWILEIRRWRWRVSKNAVDSMQSKTGTRRISRTQQEAEHSRVGAKQKATWGPWGFREQH